MAEWLSAQLHAGRVPIIHGTAEPAEVAPAVSAEAPVVEAVSTVDADAAAVTQTTEPVDAPETSTEASVEEAPAAVAPAAPRRGKSRR